MITCKFLYSSYDKLIEKYNYIFLLYYIFGFQGKILLILTIVRCLCECSSLWQLIIYMGWVVHSEFT